jgi:8-oxo-dGTP diphosphatase
MRRRARVSRPGPTGPSRVVALGILASGKRVLLQRRTDRGPLSGLWEFPGGKVEFGEHPWEALRRELEEELSLHVTRGRLFGVYSHVYDFDDGRLHVVLVAYLVPLSRSRVAPSRGRAWVPVRELSGWPVVPGSRPIIDDLVDRVI